MPGRVLSALCILSPTKIPQREQRVTVPFYRQGNRTREWSHLLNDFIQHSWEQEELMLDLGSTWVYFDHHTELPPWVVLAPGTERGSASVVAGEGGQWVCSPRWVNFLAATTAWSTYGSSRSFSRAFHSLPHSSSAIRPLLEKEADNVSFLDEKQKLGAWSPLAWSPRGQDQNILLALEFNPAPYPLGPTNTPSFPRSGRGLGPLWKHLAPEDVSWETCIHPPWGLHWAKRWWDLRNCEPAALIPPPPNHQRLWGGRRAGRRRSIGRVLTPQPQPTSFPIRVTPELSWWKSWRKWAGVWTYT